MLATYERRRFQTELINEMPLYPTERLLWDENQVPSAHYTGGTLARAKSCGPCERQGPTRTTWMPVRALQSFRLLVLYPEYCDPLDSRRQQQDSLWRHCADYRIT